MTLRRLRRRIKVAFCLILQVWFWIGVSMAAQLMTIHAGIWHPAFWLVFNAVGPSTEYHKPMIATAEKGTDGREYVYIGEEFYVWIWVVRHKVNGNCLFDIERYAEATDGPAKGVRRLISTEWLQFIGADDMRRTRWPQPPTKLILRYEIDKRGRPLDGSVILDEDGHAIFNAQGQPERYPYRPLLPDDVDEQEFDFFVVGRYYCNPLDDLWPRYIQGGRPNETERVHAVIKRTRP